MSKNQQSNESAAIGFLFFIAVIAGLISMAVEWVNDYKIGKEREPVEIALSQVCKGTGIAEAASYDSQKPAIHPIVILLASGEPHEWTIKLPDNWYPSTISEAELVACVGDQIDIKIQTCNYGDFGIKTTTLTRYQIKRSFQIREAKTGNIVIEETVTGSMPPACPETTKNGGRLDGSQLDYTWFSEYVSPLIQGAANP